MKKRLISALLTLCILLSSFAVFSFTSYADEVTEEEEDNLVVLYNRNFEEGWDYDNGMSPSGSGKIDYRINYKSNYDFTYNYYLNFTPKDDLNGFLALNAGAAYAKQGEKQFIEFDVMGNEGCNVGGMIQTVSPGSGSDRFFLYLVSYKDGYLYVLDEKVCPASSSEWVHLGFILDYSYDSPTYPGSTVPQEFKVTAFCSALDEPIERIYSNGKGGCGVASWRIGCQARGNRAGHWFALDNLKIYSGVNDFTELDPAIHGYGTVVSTTREKTVEILGSSTGVEVPLEQKLRESLVMKVNVEYCLDNNTRTPIYTAEDGTVYGAPTRVDGRVMLPLERILEFFGYPYYLHPDGMSFDISTGESTTYMTVGRDTATVGGNRITLSVAPGFVTVGDQEYLGIALDDFAALFPGFHLVWDDMGLVVISEYENLLNREEHLNTMVSLMQKFVFDYATPETIYKMTEQTTENFTHPYLYADAEQFEQIIAGYNAQEGDPDYNEEYTRLIKARVNNGINNYKSRAELDEDGNYVRVKPTSVPVNPNDTPDGYDAAGGRLSVPSGFLQDLGFAAIVTGDVNYAKFAYDYIVYLGKWDHWGPGHFLNCADAAAPVAACMDFIHNIIEGLDDPDYDMDVLYEILWEDAVNMGYIAMQEKPCPWPSTLQSGGFVYHKKANNWNAVCTSGMVISALALMGYDKYAQQCCELISDNLYHLANYGMGQYVPDGSYCESPGYWAYGTNSMFKMCAALIPSTGSDFGYMDCWGIDKTCYFACHAESSDYKAFGYHDGSSATVDTSYFAFVANALSDDQLMGIIKSQIKNGKGTSLFDVLYYEFEDVQGDLDLQYHMVGIDGYTMRSSWDKGAIFVGILNGDNNAPHGQYDCGTWVYHSSGIIWFTELGADNYNIKSYFGNGNYYRISSEGNNVVMVVSDQKTLPYGQLEMAVGKIVETGSNEYGAYSIADNTEVYSKTVVSAKRGTLLTNDRKTTVIQDEISFDGIQSMYWFAHYDIGIVSDIKISTDKRTAYLEAVDAKGQIHTLRATIVSKVKNLRFSIMTAYDFVLDKTMTADAIKEISNGQEEYDRSSFMKLAIKAQDVLSFDCAVVIEEIDTKQEIEVGYTWTDMKDWAPARDNRDGLIQVDEKLRAIAKLSDIVASATRTERYRDDGTAYGASYKLYYRALTDLLYACESFKNSTNLPAAAQTAKEKSADWITEYDAHAKRCNDMVSGAGDMVRSAMFGF